MDSGGADEADLTVGAAVEAVDGPGGAGVAAEGELGGAEAGGGDALYAGAEEVGIVDVAGGDGEGADGLFVEDFALRDIAGGGADFEHHVDAVCWSTARRMPVCW